jgi:hypothetical protein
MEQFVRLLKLGFEVVARTLQLQSDVHQPLAFKEVNIQLKEGFKI